MKAHKGYPDSLKLKSGDRYLSALMANMLGMAGIAKETGLVYVCAPNDLK